MINDHRIRKSLLDAYQPALIHLTENLAAAAFPLMKIYPAAMCLDKAITEGTIQPDSLVVESSSGTMALGLAIVSQWSGHKLAIVSDPVCDPMLQNRLRDLGADVEIVTNPAAVGGYQRARLHRVDAICSATKNSWWVNQYDNIGNAEAYSLFAAQLVESLGKIDYLVGTVGSGGSICGTAAYLRMLFPGLIVVGVDTFGSVLFGQPDAPRALRGLGNSLLPKNLVHAAFDGIHWVSAAEAYTATRDLHRETALFRGGTSGAAWIVARYYAQCNPGSRVVCLFPDDGHRYMDSIYNDRYMNENNFWTTLPEMPRTVEFPEDACSVWSCMNWGRRTYEEVVRGSRIRMKEKTPALAKVTFS